MSTPSAAGLSVRPRDRRLPAADAALVPPSLRGGAATPIGGGSLAPMAAPLRAGHPGRGDRRGLPAALMASAVVHVVLAVAILLNLEVEPPKEPAPVEAVPIELVAEPPAPQPEAQSAAAPAPAPPPPPPPAPEETAAEGEGAPFGQDLAEALAAMASVPVLPDVGTPTTFDGEAEPTDGEGPAAEQPSEDPAETEAPEPAPAATLDTPPAETEAAESEAAETEPAEAEPAEPEPAAPEQEAADPATTATGTETAGSADAVAAAATEADAAGAAGEPDGTATGAVVLATPGEAGEVASEPLAAGEGAPEASTGDASNAAVPRPKPVRPAAVAARTERATVAYTQAIRSAISSPFFREMDRMRARNVSARGVALVEVSIRRDGSVVSATLVQPSGNSALDAAALMAAREARYPAFAPDMTGETFAIHIPLRAF